MAFNTVGVEFEAKEFDPFERIIKSADKLIGGLNKSIDKTVQSMNKLEGRSRTFARTQRTQNEQFTRSTRQVTNYTQSLDDLETGLSDVQLGMLSGATAMDRFEEVQERTARQSEELASNLGRVNTRMRTLNQSVRGGGLTRLGSGMTSAGRGANTLRDNLRGAITKVKELGAESLQTADKVTSLAGSLAKKATQGLLAVGLAGSVAIGASINTASSFESAFVGVGKTVDGLVELSEDGFLEMTEAGESFRDSLEDLTETTLPTTFEEAAKVAELAGQLGFTEGIDDIGKTQEALLAFTETIIGLEEATDLTAESAAQDLSRFANIFSSQFDDAGENIRNIGNTIVGLGNRSATTESQIVSFATRMAGAASAVGLTQADVLGISAAFSSIGINAEAGGTAVSRVLLELQKAANATNEGFIDNAEAVAEAERKQRDMIGALRTLEAQTGLSAQSILDQQEAFVAAGGSVAEFGELLGDTRQRRLLGMIEDINELEASTEQLRRTHGQPFSSQLLGNFLEVTGLTRDEFVELQRTNPAELFETLIQGIGAQGDEAGATLEALGFNTAQLRQALLGMAQNTDILTDSLAFASEEFENGSAQADETSKRYATFESRLQLFKNTIRGTAADIGDVFLPAIANMLQGAGGAIDVFGDRFPEVIDALVSKAGELSGLDFSDFDLETTVDAGLTALIETINNFDVTPIQTGIDLLTGTVFPAFAEGVSFVSENWEAFESLLIGLGTVGGVLVTVSTIASVAAAVAALVSPIGLAIAGVTALSFAWQTNWLGIQDVTANAVQFVQDNVAGITEAFNTEGLDGVFDFLEIPEPIRAGIDSLLGSFDDLTIGDSVSGFFTSLEDLFSGPSLDVIVNGATAVAQGVGVVAGAALALGGIVVSSTLDRLQSLIDIGANLIGFFDGLLELDGEKIKESLSGIGTGLLDFALSPFETLAETITGQEIDFTTPITTGLAAAAQSVTDFIWPLLPEFDTSVITEFVWPEFPLPELPDITAFSTDLKTAFDNEGFDGVFDFLGLSEDFQAGIDQLLAPLQDIEIPESLTNLQTQVTNLFSGESAETLASAAETVGSAISGLVSTLVEVATPAATTLLTLLGDGLVVVGQAVAGLAVAAIGTAADVVSGVVDLVASLIGVADSLLEGNLAGATEQVNNFIDAIVGIALSPIENLGEVITGEDLDIEAVIETALADAAAFVTDFTWPEFPEFVWPDLGVPTLDLGDLGLQIIEGTESLKTLFGGVLDDVSLGIPSFPDLLAMADEIVTGLKDKFTNLLSGIDLGFPELPETVTNLLPEFQLPEVVTDLVPALDFSEAEQQAEQQGQNIGQAINDGTSQGLEESEEGLLSTLGNTAESAWNSMTDWWESESPSERTKRLGRDVGDGFGIGLGESEAIQPALDQLNILVLAGFTAMTDAITLGVQPALDTFTFALDNLNLITFPTTIGLLTDSLIPAKQTLAVVNETEVTPSVNNLTASEEELASVIEARVVPNLGAQIGVMESAEGAAKALDKAIKNLVKRYNALAAAIAKARRQGSGVGTASGNEPIGGANPAGAFASGGSFVVPNTIPRDVQGPTGGMIIEVHPRELVNIIPAQLANNIPESAPINAQPFSGASLQPAITNVSSETIQQNFSLHVTEAVGPSFSSGFGLLQSLAPLRRA